MKNSNDYGLSGRRRSIPGIPIPETELGAKVRAIANQLLRGAAFCGHDSSGFDRLITVAGRSMIEHTAAPDSMTGKKESV